MLSVRDAFCWSRHRLAAMLCLVHLGLAPVACVHTPRAVVPVRLQRTPATPRDADVLVDEEYVGPLYLVAVQGLRLPVGTHRITVTSQGYFPWDRLVEADRTPVHLSVDLVPIPE
jgi:hypothetical protein